MAGKYAKTLSSLTLALALGACGGGTSDSEETVVVDPAAEPAAEPAAALPEDSAADTMASEPVATDEAAMSAEADSDGWMTMQGDWENSAGIVKDRWTELSEEEILATGGDREQLVGLVQERYGIERDQAEQEVNDWAAAL